MAVPVRNMSREVVAAFNAGAWEGVEVLPSSYSAKPVTVKATGSAYEDIAEYYQSAVKESENKGGENRLFHASVTVSQAEKPSASYNTTSPTTKNGRPNVLYTKGWLGPTRS